MSEDEIIDRILKEMKEGDPNPSFIPVILGRLKIDDSTYRIYVDKLITYNLAKLLHEGTGSMQITTKGREIVEVGGWLIHKQNLRKEEEKKNRIEEIEYNKLRHDSALSRWQVITFWPLFIIAVIGGILGALAFFGQLGYLKFMQP